jgi:hypothetical protein
MNWVIAQPGILINEPTFRKSILSSPGARAAFSSINLALITPAEKALKKMRS